MISLNQIKSLVMIAVAVFNLTSGQEKQLDSYVKMNANDWIARRRDAAEVEASINAEARRIARSN